MRQRSNSRSALSGFGVVAIGLTCCIFLAAATLAALWRAGFFQPTEPSREGMTAVPALARDVTAYSAIVPEDLINPQTHQLNVVWVATELATKGVFTEGSQIVGRVLARDRKATSALTEKDFLPRGTRPGVTGGVPPGKRALTIPAEKIDGLELLRQGDTFDLVVALPPQAALDQSNVEYAVLLGGIKPSDTKAGQLARQTGVRTLAREGTMVALIQGKTASTSGRQGLTVPTTNRTNKATEVQAIVAIGPDEVTRVSEALGQDLKIFCVAHSGHAEAAEHRQSEPSLEGMVPIPAPVNRLAAFSAITQADLADSVTGKLNVYYFPPEKVSPDWKKDFTQLIGRVVAREIEPGTVLTDADLLPVGTRPGPSAGAPAGMVVLQVPVERIKGISGLSRGDRFAIHAQLPQEIRPAFGGVEWATIAGGQLSPDDLQLQEELRTGVRVVAEEAVLVQPLATQNQDKKEGPQEISIAVPQVSAFSIAQFIRMDVPLSILIHSSRTNELQEQNQPLLAKPPAQAFFDGVFQKGESTIIRTAAMQQTEKTESFPDRGLRQFPVTARPIAPFTKLTIEDFVDPSTGKVRYFYFPDRSVKKGWIEEMPALLDRVTACGIDQGHVISLDDLLPEGTRPGPTAGIPPNQVMFALTSAMVDGLQNFGPLDHVDIVAARPIKATQLEDKSIWPKAIPERTFALAKGTDIFEQADITVVAYDAKICTVHEREEEQLSEVVQESVVREQSIGGILTQQGIERTKTPVTMKVKREWFTVALAPQDATAISEALGTKVKLFAVARSSLPMVQKELPQVPRRDVVADWVSDWSGRYSSFMKVIGKEFQGVRTVEHITGSQRNTQYWLNGQSFGSNPLSPLSAPIVDSATDVLLQHQSHELDFEKTPAEDAVIRQLQIHTKNPSSAILKP